MKNEYRNVEDDIKGLVKVFRKCFDRNDNPIPLYKGQDIERKAHDGFKIKDRLKPGKDEFEGMRYETEQGRDLVDVLLSGAFQLGYDLCCVTKVEELQKHQELIGHILDELKTKREHYNAGSNPASLP